jgi:hypothetical protein
MTTDSRSSSRRALLKGVAWATPVAAASMAAPTYAASPCADQQYSTSFEAGHYTRTSTTEASGRTLPITGAAPVTYTVKAVANGATLAPANLQATQSATGVGGTGRRASQLIQTTGLAPNNQTVTFTFSRAVRNLTFFVTDFDRATGTAPWYDQAVLSGSPVISELGPIIDPASLGTAAQPIRSTPTAPAIETSDARGNVRVTYPGPLSSFTITFSSIAGAGNQNIFITTMDFIAPRCA